MSCQDLLEDKNTGGFTLIELLLIVALIAILAAASTPFLSNFVLRTHFDSTEDKLISSIRKAQAYSMDGKNNASWGVCHINKTIRLFTGSCNSPSYSEDFSVPNSVTVTGLDQTTFNIRGEPNAERSITIKSALDTQTMTINVAGGLEYN